MKIASLALILVQCALLLPAAAQETFADKDAVAVKIEALPKEERDIALRNAATFTKNDWDNFLKDLSQNYQLAPDGTVFAVNEPEPERVPAVPSPRFATYLSWRLQPVAVPRYHQISGNVTAIPQPGLLIVGSTPVRVGPASAKFAEGDAYSAWCERAAPYTYVDDFGEPHRVRSYAPVAVKKPELIDISNYLVKGGRIYGLAPFRTKMCPVCKGFRKYSPNPEIPSETTPCGTCDQTGKVSIRPLYMVYTGSAP